MSTQAEIDLEARIGDLERQLAELAAKVNPLYSGGMDRYIHSGYLQFDGVPIRWGADGMQIASVGSQIVGLYFVNVLSTDPGNESRRAELFGGPVGTTAVLAGLQTIQNGNIGQVIMSTGDATAYSELNYFLNTSGSRPRAKLYPLTGDIGKLELQDAVLRFEGLASDPGTLEDGLVWYNTTSNQLKARVNGSTVVLA